MKINKSNRTEIVDLYLNALGKDLIEEMPKYKLYEYSRNFLLQEKTDMSNEDLEREILESYPYLLEENNNRINNENRIYKISEYVNMLISDLTTEIPRYTLYNYAISFIRSEIAFLTDEHLEIEINEKYPNLLEDYTT